MILNINLQPANYIGSGIAKYTNELTMLLYNSNVYKINGVFNYVRNVKPKDLSRFKFNIHYSYIPYKLVYSQLINGKLPINYSFIAGQKADVNLFFTYRIPRVRYSGLTISTIHDLIPLKTEVESKKAKENYINDIEYTLNNSDYIITVSNSSKQDIIEMFNYDPNKIVIIPNGVNFNEYNIDIPSKKKSLVKEKYKLPNNFILYMGGMRKHKNIENLIKAYSLLDISLKRKYSLVITQGTDSLRRLVKNMELDKYVMFIPFVDEEDKVCIYQLADVFAFISSYEGFGIPVIEAQAAGTPVITSSVSSLAEIGRDSTLLVNPTDLKSISSGIKVLLTDVTICNDLINKGYINAKKYSWINAGEKLCNFLNSL